VLDIKVLNISAQCHLTVSTGEFNALAHVILLGDSILDNQSYVQPGPAVVEQLRSRLPHDTITLLAVDGSITTEVTDDQLPKLPQNATHLIISTGGNDALRAGMSLTQDPPADALAMLQRLSEIKALFERDYRQMLKTALAAGLQTTLCTIYDHCPVQDPVMRQLAYAVLPMFNDCITRQAFEARLPLLDLRVICGEAADYAAVSPIEPSVQGGEKICDRIVQLLQNQLLQNQLLQNQDFRPGPSTVYA
jgi:hypothetical protein